MASTVQTFDPFLKTNYDDEEVTRLVCKDRPFLAKLLSGGKKLGSGNLWTVPAVISNPQGHAATVAKAQAAASQSGGGGNLKGIKWNIAWGDYSSHVEIGDKVIKESRNNIGAFFENQKAEIDALYDGFADIMANYVIGDQGHSVTPGGFTISAGVCSLNSPDDIVNVFVGMVMVASANDGTSAAHTLLGTGSQGYVTAINPNAGQFTVSATAGGSAGVPTGWTGTMYGFRDGDFGGSGATRILLGLSAWVPMSDPTSTLFETVDRTVSMTALSGVRLTSAEIQGLNIEQRTKRLVTRMTGRGMGPGPTDLFMNPEKWQVLADSLESRGTRPLNGAIGQYNYQKIQIAAGGKLVDVWADRFCPVGRGFALNMDYVELRSLDGFPAVVNGDGLTMLRKSGSNDYEYRLCAYPGFVVRAPGYNGVVPV
jgi:hypothetical protein